MIQIYFFDTLKFCITPPITLPWKNSSMFLVPLEEDDHVVASGYYKVLQFNSKP